MQKVPIVRTIKEAEKNQDRTTAAGERKGYGMLASNACIKWDESDKPAKTSTKERLSQSKWSMKKLSRTEELKEWASNTKKNDFTLIVF
jgi:hypothetical protein